MFVNSFRDYKQEYEKLKAEKLLETVKKTQERLSQIQVQGPGTTVEMNSLVTQVRSLSDCHFFISFLAMDFFYRRQKSIIRVKFGSNIREMKVLKTKRAPKKNTML